MHVGVGGRPEVRFVVDHVVADPAVFGGAVPIDQVSHELVLVYGPVSLRGSLFAGEGCNTGGSPIGRGVIAGDRVAGGRNWRATL